MAQAGDPSPAAPEPAAPEPPKYETVVTVATPLHGSGLPARGVPANVQTVTAAQLAGQQAWTVRATSGNVGGVHVNDVQAVPLQPDLQYRGFLASPLLGAPQGLSMYLDGVRLNEPFGDTINWDLIPTNAIASRERHSGVEPNLWPQHFGRRAVARDQDGFLRRRARRQPALRLVGTEARARERRNARRAIRRFRGGAGPRRDRVAPTLAHPRGAGASLSASYRDRGAPPISRCWLRHQPDRQRAGARAIARGRSAQYSPFPTPPRIRCSWRWCAASVRSRRRCAVGNRLRAHQSHPVGQWRPARLVRVHHDGRRALLDRRRAARRFRARRASGTPVAFSDATTPR